MNVKTSLFLLILFMTACAVPEEQNNERSVEQGRLVVTIAEAGGELKSVSSLSLTIDEVLLLNKQGEWISVLEDPRIIDLVELAAREDLMLIGQTEIPQGTYTKIKLNIGDTIINNQEVFFPSDEIIVNGIVEVNQREVSSLSFALQAADSLHLTKEGRYLMAPVLEIESRGNVEARVVGDDLVELVNGQVLTKGKIGMNLQGEMKFNYELPDKIQVSVQSNTEDNSVVIVYDDQNGTSGVSIDATSRTRIDTSKDEQEEESYVDIRIY